MSNASPAIGIDLGTTYCCVGYFNERSNEVDIIDNTLGHRTTPSYVAFTDKDELIGKPAKDKVLRIPQNVVYDSKRLIGRHFDETYLKQIRYNWSFDISVGEEGTPLIHISQNGKITKYKPEEISAKLLRYMKTSTEERLGKKIKDLVITVPAYFNYHQRKATKEAARLAGLNVLRIINEPTAAALAYVHKHDITGENNILVFDLGGGTLDVSIVEIKEGSITVQATSGNSNLGGRDFDNNLAKLIVDKIRINHKKDVTIDKNYKKIMGRINRECEKLKIKLSSEESTIAGFISLFDQIDMDIDIKREEFEDVNKTLFQECLSIVENCLEDANIKKNKIDKIILIGGSTRIPKIQEMLKTSFAGKGLTKTINPDEAVATGAAVQASIMKNNKKVVAHRVTDITPLSLGIDLIGGVMEIVIPRKTQIPVIQTSTYHTVTDKQTNADIHILEGQRCLTKYNTIIGTCKMQLPPKPPGYPIEVSFYIDSSGILEVGTKTELGVYKSLAIEYGNQTKQILNNILQDSRKNQQRDENICNVIKKWKTLQNYCTMMLALCTYDKKSMTNEDKNIIERSCGYYSNWLQNHEVKDGSVDEENAIMCMQKAIEVVCEPVVNKYEYFVKGMSWGQFHKIVT